MKEIHLHVGLHKTGTTALQKFCATKSADLNANGISFPDLSFPAKSRWNGNASVSIQSLFSDRAHYLLQSSLPSEGRPTTLDLIHKLKSEGSHGATLVSAEAISAFRPEELLNLIAFLENDCRFQRIIVYLTVRECYSFLCSDIQQRIKMGYPCMRGIRDGAYLLPKVSQRVSNIVKAFDRHEVVFIDFGDAKATGGIELSFFSAFNKHSLATSYSPKPDDIARPMNESLGNVTIRIMDIYNELKPYGGTSGRKDVTVGLANLRHLDDLIPGQSRFLLSERELAQCSEFIEIQNRELSSITGYNLTARDAQATKEISENEALCYLVEAALKAL